MTGFHAHRHTSLLTGLRTHRLTRLVPAQHPETEARLLAPQVHLHVLVVGAYGQSGTGEAPRAVTASLKAADLT